MQMEGSEDLIKGTSIMCIKFNLYRVDIVQKRGLQSLVTLVIMGSQQLQYISQENLAIVRERALYTTLNIPT